MKKIQLIFLGAPGSGKGTQASKLAKECGFFHISTGDLLREEVKKGTPLGDEVKGIMESGGLVSDQTVIKLLKANCDLNSGNYILDGFPRNYEQALILDKDFLHGMDYKAVDFNLPIETVVDRLIQRRVCSKCQAIYNLSSNPPANEGMCDRCESPLLHRSDDREDTVRARIRVFEDSITPVKNFYDENGHLITMDASKKSEDVFVDLKRLLDL